jgi:hypothetical protein
MVAVLLGHQDALNIARVAQRLGALAASFVLRVSEIIRGTGDGVAFVASSGVQTDVISSGTDVLLALVNIDANASVAPQSVTVRTRASVAPRDVFTSAYAKPFISEFITFVDIRTSSVVII